ncbi:peptidase inhibitor family I36 protein [Streptomyces sp. NPDC015220]|uniref:peptidase inhibitor family I36 protein n=1 Tax=Streptomyces sp. NPDC015220 TaxID=3364947 RepID=UPI0036FA0CFD
MRHIKSLAVAAAAFAAAIGTGPAVTAAPAAGGNLAAYNCTSGYFCIYSDWNGGGTRCQWSQASKANTADNCSFIQRGKNVLSVWNGTGHRVQYYTHTNYNSRVGSTAAATGGNLQGSYQIRSFKPQ